MFNFSEEFIQKLVQKEKTTFNEFYIKTVDIFFRYLKSNYFLDNTQVYDILSDFYLKIWNSLDKYSFEYSFNGWVWIVFKNITKDYFKSMKTQSFLKYPEKEDFALEDVILSDDKIQNQLEESYKFESIKKEIEKLDEDSKQILYFKFIQNLTNKEIAEIV